MAFEHNQFLAIQELIHELIDKYNEQFKSQNQHIIKMWNDSFSQLRAAIQANVTRIERTIETNVEGEAKARYKTNISNTGVREKVQAKDVYGFRHSQLIERVCLILLEIQRRESN